jgi:murein DD-endopeptidase MepM/ murein hydrolase activator NlpD
MINSLQKMAKFGHFLLKNYMKHPFIITFLIIIILGGLIFWRIEKTNAPILTENQAQSLPTQNTLPAPELSPTPAQKNSEWLSPLDRAKERVTKKPFGIHIDPKTSPVQPEKFSGYHTGTDFEIFPEELNVAISVRAICDGKLLLKKTASGYGGVAVQSCNLGNQPITVTYGHLKLTSITKSVGDDLKAGDTLGQLGAAYSAETDGERKHLHLSIRKGSAINLLGYVQAKNELTSWVDPCLYACE